MKKLGSPLVLTALILVAPNLYSQVVKIRNGWEKRVPGTPPAAHSYHTVVWTGSEMIVWGGEGNAGSLLNDGGRYNPAGNCWTAVSTAGAPSSRRDYTAVWTGSEMIVWGGAFYDGITHYLNDGGGYNPAVDGWMPIANTLQNTPTRRYAHTAVWTGSEMIIWGGYDGNSSPSYLNTGASYQPAANKWTEVSASGAPPGRQYHTAVWTDSEMIVWGGLDGVNSLNTGGRYNPVAGSWTPIVNTLPGTPVARSRHTAVWTGSEMIVWGGSYDDGGRYYPVGNSWTPVTTTGAPTAREGHMAVWTGSEMIIWGGYDANSSPSYLNTGASYQPSGNSWTPVTTIGAPTGRLFHTAVWTGSEMIVWGGYNGSNDLNDGGRYYLAGNSWTAVTTTDAPAERRYHTAVWTGSEMIVWGGSDSGGFLKDGGRYNPALNCWAVVITPNALVGRQYHTAVWTGSEMIVWGGEGGNSYLNDGGRYNPAGNSWTLIVNTLPNTPAPRSRHAAVWTGSEMIVWGGTPDSVEAFNDGGRYNPVGNSWAPIVNTLPNTPSPRADHPAVWTGNEMIVWGGVGRFNYFGDGGRYDPAANSWTGIPDSLPNTPSARWNHSAVWTGSEMIIWGGLGFKELNTGGRYNPTGNSWTPMTTTGAPGARDYHTAVWTGNEMIVWGGFDGSPLNTGARYNPTGNTWTPVTTTGAPAARWHHTAVWTGGEMIVWGGEGSGVYFNDTFSYSPTSDFFGITGVVLSAGNLILSFPTVRGWTYTLWRSDTFPGGSWIDTGLTTIGNGAIRTFTVPVTTPGSFFRVQASP